MIVVLGATGNTGSVVVNRLLALGKPVRAVGRDINRLGPLMQAGAEVATAEAGDNAAMARTLQGAAVAYLMLPPRPKDPELLATGDKMSSAITEALKSSGVSHVVLLSSIGAQHGDKTGPIRGLHAFEQKLRNVPGLNAVFLRPGPFLENFLMLIPLIRSMGFLAGGINSDLKMPFVATRDIGAAAADLLANPDFTGISIRELQGQRDLTHDEAATAIGVAIGKPKLSYQRFPAFLVEQGMKQMGIPGKTSSLMSEMNEAANEGLLKPQERRTPQNTTATSIEEWAREVFEPAYRAKAADA
jgi:uncharacterized protein YbjT (DUF2867 family)